eukprot:s1433_g5.t1
MEIHVLEDVNVCSVSVSNGEVADAYVAERAIAFDRSRFRIWPASVLPAHSALQVSAEDEARGGLRPVLHPLVPDGLLGGEAREVRGERLRGRLGEVPCLRAVGTAAEGPRADR